MDEWVYCLAKVFKIQIWHLAARAELEEQLTQLFPIL